MRGWCSYWNLGIQHFHSPSDFQEARQGLDWVFCLGFSHGKSDRICLKMNVPIWKPAFPVGFPSRNRADLDRLDAQPLKAPYSEPSWHNTIDPSAWCLRGLFIRWVMRMVSLGRGLLRWSSEQKNLTHLSPLHEVSFGAQTESLVILEPVKCGNHCVRNRVTRFFVNSGLSFYPLRKCVLCDGITNNLMHHQQSYRVGWDF